MMDRGNPLSQVVGGQVGGVQESKEREEFELASVKELLRQRISSLEKEMVLRFKFLSDELTWAKAELKREIRNGVKLLLNGGEQVEEKRAVSLDKLNEFELEVVEEFVEWMWDNLGKWLDRYREGKAEGYDPRVQRLYLQKRTMQEFFGRVAKMGSNEREVKRLLARLGVLQYRDEGGQYQYIMSVDIGKQRGVSVYVVDVKRAIEVADELEGERVRRKERQELNIPKPEGDDLPF